jgi:hypothetical protein
MSNFYAVYSKYMTGFQIFNKDRQVVHSLDPLDSSDVFFCDPHNHIKHLDNVVDSLYQNCLQHVKHVLRCRYTAIEKHIDHIDAKIQENTLHAYYLHNDIIWQDDSLIDSGKKESTHHTPVFIFKSCAEFLRDSPHVISGDVIHSKNPKSVYSYFYEVLRDRILTERDIKLSEINQLQSDANELENVYLKHIKAIK